MARIPYGDIIIVIPGILGSSLERNGRQVWGYRSISRSIHVLANRLTEDLSLPFDAYRDPTAGFDDGVRPTGLLSSHGIIPGFLAIDGYGEFLVKLRRMFAEDNSAVVEFPYDWRQSNEYTARRLREFAMSLISARRSSYPLAKLILLGHSMGGLVAQYYAECLDHEQHVRRVVTIGTPYLGSIKALILLANKYTEIGPVRINFGSLARTLPSVAELLPTYDCIETDSGPTMRPAEAVIPNLSANAVSRSIRFHKAISDAAVSREGIGPTYHALLSHRQRTDASAYVDDSGRVLARESTDFEDGGDGTVIRLSATPANWSDDSHAVFVSGRHAVLPRQRSTMMALQGILTAKPRYPQAVGDELAVSADQFVPVGDSLTVRAYSAEGSNSLALTARVFSISDDTFDEVANIPLRADGGGSYAASIPMTSYGPFQWFVHSAQMSAIPLESVSDLFLCCSD